MIDHVSVGVTNIKTARFFYEGFLSALGFGVQRDSASEVAFGTTSHWGLFLYPVAPGDAITGSRSHVALAAATRHAVEEAFAAAQSLGSTPLFAPTVRPDISPTYFGAMFKDVDGNKIELVTNAPA